MKNKKIEKIKLDLRGKIQRLRQNTPIDKLGKAGIGLYLDGYVTCLVNYDVASVREVKAIYKSVMRSV